MSILGNVADTGLPNPANVCFGDVITGEEHHPCCRSAHAHGDFDQFSLTVALHPGDAQDLTGMNGEGDVVQSLCLALNAQIDVPQLQHHGLGNGGFLGLRRGEFGSDHEFCELSGGHSLRINLCHGGAAPDDGDVVGD